jgi:hypothetical protein
LSFTLGVFDVFGSTVPGAAYLSVLAYVLNRLGWTEPFRPLLGNTTLVVIGFAVLSYATGMVTYGMARWVSRALSRHEPRERAVAFFLANCPAAAGRPFVSTDKFLLLAKIEMLSPEAANEISRVRAGATMLRGLIIPAGLASLACLVDFAVPDHEPGLLPAAAVFAGISLLAHRRALEMATWAHQSTLERAYWIPEIDQVIGRPTP